MYHTVKGLKPFPSPLGAMGSLIKDFIALHDQCIVSVPSRGNGVLNTVKALVGDSTGTVSVPSRGNGVLNEARKMMTISKRLFPSPLGAMGSLIAYLVAIKNDPLHLVFSR